MRFWPEFVMTAALVVAESAGAAEPTRPVEFNRDVRPILADHCFQCHGPDAAQRKADLRLDIEPKSDREGGPVTPGQPDKSELYRRIISTDEGEQMPPPGKGRRLSDTELSTLRQWIASGAKFEKHWSLLPISRPNVVVDTLRVPSWPTSPLDTFILARLEKSNLTPSPPADPATLLRRVSFALTGLPPSIDEIETFLADVSPDAYEKTVDRLLASPRYGERLAVPWLDAARYADTSGYQSDGERYMWRWRDWVIEALNANMPFDQFTIEQIAGDLLPSATLDQKIATGFNRNHRGNAEGGIIPEEYAAEYVADRVETTATVWLGLTLGCCRCHDHKYDPFTQKDFYSLFAFFNNIPEKGRAIKIGNSPPYVQAPTRLQDEELERLASRHIASLEKLNVETDADKLLSHYIPWRRRAENRRFGDWYPSEQLAFHFSFDSQFSDEITRRTPEIAGNPKFTQGRLRDSVLFDGQSSLTLNKAGDFGFFDKFTLAAWIKVYAGGGGTIVSRMSDAPEGEGYQLAVIGGKVQFNLAKRWLDDALRVETAEPLSTNDWHHITAIYDGSRTAEGVKLFVDGKVQKLNVLLDELNQTFATKEPLRIGGGGGADGRFRGLIDELRVYTTAIPTRDVQILATPESIDEIIAGAYGPSTTEKLYEYYLWNHAPADLQAAERETRAALRDLLEFDEKLPTVMVMEEMSTPRETHILLRGQYDKPGDPVHPNTPAELPPLAATLTRSVSEGLSRTAGASSSPSTPTKSASLPLPLGEGRGEGSQTGSQRESKPESTLNLEPRTLNSTPNRLDLAKWLISRENPLTPRVIVNRAWQLHFGTGLVKTSEDFGRQGESPSHPDLLDHLAAEFQSDWDVKRLHRTIVTSATFRQSSGFRVQGSELSSLNPEPRTLNPSGVDPNNRLLSRGPRLRLSAEQLRDQALFASGQLVEQLGGPSVKPLQPPGLWSELTGGDDYQPGQGADLVRRSLYTFWKRTIPPPTLSTFDSPTREACTVRDSRTNTPLQALALLNEPTFVSASRALAERIIHEAQTPEDRITRAVLHILNRRPTTEELQILNTALQRYLHQSSQPGPNLVPERREETNQSELAAYTLLCTTILNLDEAITSQ